MKVAVWDTYVTKRDGTVMHFDIIVPESIKDEATVYAFGRQYLDSVNESGRPLAAKECRFCHLERATPEIEEAIKEKGYYILEMQNCG